jgi:multiple sugar transport system permease protein
MHRSPPYAPHLLTMKRNLPPKARWLLEVLPFNLFVWLLLGLYLLPVAFMGVTSLKSGFQLLDHNAPAYPARVVLYESQGREYRVYNVPTDEGVQHWALVEPGAQSSRFIDPARPEAGLIEWQGRWRSLKSVYEVHPAWENFTVLFEALPFPAMLGNTFLLAMIGEVGVLLSSIVVAYGFSRYSLPGGNLLFYILIATILIPEKVTFIPTYFFYVNVMDWKGTALPVLLHLFFGNAVYIFLLRQNFRSLPLETEEAAMIDGAGPLRRLFTIVLPQCWPVVITISLLHFFYSWNETRLASLYLGVNSGLMPVSFGVQNYQSRVPIENLVQAASLVSLVIPLLVLLLAQRYFMQGMVITGAEKQHD